MVFDFDKKKIVQNMKDYLEYSPSSQSGGK